jgi:hypothetical protein
MLKKIYLNGNYTLIQLVNIIKQHLHHITQQPISYSYNEVCPNCEPSKKNISKIDSLEVHF